MYIKWKSSVMPLVVLCSICLGLSGCGNGRVNDKYSGTIVIGWGQTIKALEFSHSKLVSEHLVRTSHDGQIETLAKLDEHRFLFDDTISHQISSYDRQTDSVRRLVTGLSPSYIPQRTTVFFYRPVPGERRTELVYAKLADLGRTFHLVDEGPFSLARPVVQIDADKIIYMRRYDRSGSLQLFDMSNSQVTSLPLFGCIPQLWRTRTKQLMCYEMSSSTEVLWNIETKTRERLAWPRGVVPLLYVNESDSVLVGFERGENHGLATYSFDSSKSSQLNILVDRDVPVGTGGALIFR